VRMIPVEAHLFLNHVPIIGLIFGLVFVTIGMSKASTEAIRAGLQIFVAVGVLAVPVGASGLVSANLLASEPWLDARAVATHQLAGILTVILLVAIAALALAALFTLRKAPTVSRAMTRAIIGLALIGLTAALGTAYLGGTLRHAELHGITSQTQFHGPRFVRSESAR
jgi:uncharacterized membrane protein